MSTILDLIGQTPIVQLQRVSEGTSAEVYVKLEAFNLGGSVKDRIAKHMVETAEAAGVLTTGKTIVEATSGNTGIGLALIGAIKGYAVVIALPETVSNERKQLIRAYGATVVETPAQEGLQGPFRVVEEYLAKGEQYVSLKQFENLANPESHYQTTGPEIEAFFDGTPDVLVAGIGTGGTITGIGRYLKEKNPKLKIIAVEPQESAVLTGGEPGPHLIQGIGAGFVPEILDQEIYDEVADVPGLEARQTAQRLGREEGLLVGFSGGAAVYAALAEAQKASANNAGKPLKILAIAPDNGERYLSTSLYQEED